MCFGMMFLIYLCGIFVVKCIHLKCVHSKYIHLKWHVSFTLEDFLRSTWNNANKLYSPDYLSASVFKDLSANQSTEFKNRYSKTVFVKCWNTINLGISIFFLLFALVVVRYGELTVSMFFLIYIRYFSRCFEISIAFAKDIFPKKKPNTFLKKRDRVNLAGKSYIELYVLAATVYTVLIPDAKNNPFEAVVQSLNIGTLTNISGAQSIIGNYNIVIFVQVFSTMTLIVLSLAAYLSRDK